jgi:hypothetical protein
MDGLFPLIFHGERSELREKYGIAERAAIQRPRVGRVFLLPPTVADASGKVMGEDSWMRQEELIKNVGFPVRCEALTALLMKRRADRLP